MIKTKKFVKTFFCGFDLYLSQKITFFVEKLKSNDSRTL